MNADEKKIVIKINGEVQNAPIEKGYAVLARKWEPGDVIQLTLPMEVHKNKANDKVEADINHLSVERGPIVYCAEFADNNGAVLNYVLKSGDEFAVSPAPALFDGVNLLKGHVEWQIKIMK